jgi:hypothetical protein
MDSLLLHSEGEAGHQDVRDEGHQWNVEVRGIHLEARLHCVVLVTVIVD